MVLLLQGDALLVTLAKNLSPSQWGDIIFKVAVRLPDERSF